MNKEVKELIDIMKEYADGFTSVLAPTEESVKALLDYINQLETNRDDAIELLSKGVTFCENDSQGAYDVCNIAINREKKAMEILERGKE